MTISLSWSNPKDGIPKITTNKEGAKLWHSEI